jgi:hypothetical protein
MAVAERLVKRLFTVGTYYLEVIELSECADTIFALIHRACLML